MEKIFTQDYCVRHNETDYSGKLSLPALGDCLLDVAGHHAIDIKFGIDSLQHQGLTWVISGLKFNIYRMPAINSLFKIKTYVSGFSRIATQRDFVVYDDNGKIAEASSEWLVLNMEKRRPVFISDLFPQLGDVCLTDSPLPRYKHLRTFEAPVSAQETRRVAYSDIDINRHLYSMRYLQMALDTFDIEYIAKHTISSVDVNFISEVLYGQTVDVVRHGDGDVHGMEMLRDGSAVFRAEFRMG